MRFRVRVFYAGVVLVALDLAKATESAAAQTRGLTTLAALRDQARPLLVFAERPDDPQFGIQLRTLTEHTTEANDRQIVVIALPYSDSGPGALQLSATEAEAVRRRFHIAPKEFAVILLGKDGRAKLRALEPIPMEKLEKTIDAMPMRKQEMRRQTQP